MTTNIIVLNLETARSPENCIWFDPVRWDDKPSLGISIGGYYDYRDQCIHWFDEYNLDEVIDNLVERAPIMVSFNGIAFDFRIMEERLRRRACLEYTEGDIREVIDLFELCDRFKMLANKSYDILREIWKVNPDIRFAEDINSLDAIAQANGLGSKLSNGAKAPRGWAEGRCSLVINHCRQNINLIRALFEKITSRAGRLARGNGNDIEVDWIGYDGQRTKPWAPHSGR